MKRAKGYTNVAEKRPQDVVSITEAVTFLKENTRAKFDESVEVHVRLNIDPKKGEQAVRGSVTLPHGTGKTVRVGVITETKADEAKKAGADVIGGQELIDKIKAGNLPDVDVLVATPDMMPKLAPAARVLGPRGLMPSPKTDTVTPQVEAIVTSLKKGKSNFKNDNTGNVHQVIGKVSFTPEQLAENYNTFITALEGCKTDAHKGQFIATISVCSTMSPSVRTK